LEAETLNNGLVQFANDACYWLLPEELDRRVLIRDAQGNVA
jgi:hypothetical protein